MRKLLIFVIALVMLTAVVPIAAQSDAQTHYMLARPLPASANIRPDFGFAYGWHRNHQSPIHHGMDYLNKRGTPVIAAGAGTVFYAGSDTDFVVGPQPNFYGNVVIIQHDFAAPEGGTVFTLYGHLDSIAVAQGQRVDQGAVIGRVGATGIAIGSHLHFEVRVGDPVNYGAVRNPELWYPPAPGRGKVIGKLVDVNGNPAMGIRVVFSTASTVQPTFTYAEASIPTDPMYGENFVMGDLSPGCYRVRVRGGAGYVYDESVCVKAGQTILLEAHMNG